MLVTLVKILVNLMPFLTTIILVFLSTLPLPIPYWSTVPPQLAIICVFYWSLYRPDLMTMFIVFLLGLVQDSLFGTPLGLSSIIFLFVRHFVVSQRRFFVGKNFYLHWISFIMLSAAMTFVMWLLLSVFQSRAVVTMAILFQYVLTILIYPVVVWFFYRFHRALTLKYVNQYEG